VFFFFFIPDLICVSHTLFHHNSMCRWMLCFSRLIFYFIFLICICRIIIYNTLFYSKSNDKYFHMLVFFWRNLLCLTVRGLFLVSSNLIFLLSGVAAMSRRIALRLNELRFLSVTEISRALFFMGNNCYLNTQILKICSVIVWVARRAEWVWKGGDITKNFPVI